jgi:hypothetical protein
MAPKYALDAQGRRCVEPKDKTKAELGRSPDGLDAMNLAYAVEDGLGLDEEPRVGMRRRW